MHLAYQNSISSEELANAAYKLSVYYRKTIPDSTTFYINKAINHAQETQDEQIIGKYYMEGGRIYEKLYMFDLSDSLYNKALLYDLSHDDRCYTLSNLLYLSKWIEDSSKYQTYLDKLEREVPDMPSEVLAYYYHKRGQRHWNELENFTALEYLLKSNNIVKDSLIYYKNNYFLRGIYARYGSYDKVLEMGFSELGELETKQAQNPKLQLYFEIIDAYYQKERLDSALYYGKKALALNDEYDDLFFLGYVYFLVGKVYLEKSELDSAYHSFQKGIARSKLRNETKERYDNYLGLALYYYAKKDWASSLNYLNKVKQSRYYLEHKDINRDVNKTFLSIYESRNQLDSAYFYLKNLYHEDIGEQRNIAFKDYTNASNMIRAYDSKEKMMMADLVEEQARKKTYAMLAIMTMLVCLVLWLLFFRIRSYNQKLNTINKKVAQKNKLLAEANNTIQEKNEALNKLVQDLDMANNKKEEVIKYLDNFAYIVAHDMKAPIQVASGFSKMLLQKNGDEMDEQSKECLNFISNDINKMALMIDDILGLAKLDQSLPQPVAVDLTETIQQINYIMRHKHVDAAFEVKIPEDLPQVWGHTTLFHKLFLNLINNAIVHNKTGQATTIQISMQDELEQAESFTFMLKDTSGGIPAYLLDTVFDLFQSSDKEQGNGIGLTICKKITDYYGRKIWIETEEGVGTRFYFELPKVINNNISTKDVNDIKTPVYAGIGA